MTQTYLKMILLFAPAFILNDILVCFVRNDGNPRLSMLAMLGGSMANILLDYVFIFLWAWAYSARTGYRAGAPYQHSHHVRPLDG